MFEFVRGCTGAVTVGISTWSVCLILQWLIPIDCRATSLYLGRLPTLTDIPAENPLHFCKPHRSFSKCAKSDDNGRPLSRKWSLDATSWAGCDIHVLTSKPFPRHVIRCHFLLRKLLWIDHHNIRYHLTVLFSPSTWRCWRSPTSAERKIGRLESSTTSTLSTGPGKSSLRVLSATYSDPKVSSSP